MTTNASSPREIELTTDASCDEGTAAWDPERLAMGELDDGFIETEVSRDAAALIVELRGSVSPHTP